MEQVGLRFEVVPSNCEEMVTYKSKPHHLSIELSLKKAKEVAKKYHDAIIIAADTFVIIQGKILGKPRTEAEAKQILETLRGKHHSVITGFTIIDTGNNKTVSRSVETKVYIKDLSSKEIDSYVNSEEPFGKAGAYAIQGLGSVIVDRIEGDYYNVVGLPLSALVQSLKEFGVFIL